MKIGWIENAINRQVLHAIGMTATREKKIPLYGRNNAVSFGFKGEKVVIPIETKWREESFFIPIM